MENVSLRITADGSLAVREFDRVSRSVGGVGTAATEAAREAEAVMGRLSGVAAMAASAFSVGEMSAAVDAWKDINAQLAIATGSLRGGTEAYRSVLEIATATGQALGQVSNVYRRFAENAATLGLSQQQVAATTRTVSQAIALSGGSAQSAQNALMQFGQALAAGALRGEELNSILEQAPPLARALADGLGVPIGQLRKLAEEGRITSTEIARALDSQSARIAANFEKLPMTMGRAMENLRTRWVDTMGGFEESSGVFGRMATAVDAAARNMDTLVAVGGTVVALYGARMTAALATATAAKAANAAAAIRQAQAQAAASVAAQRYTGLMVSQAAAVAASTASLTAAASGAAVAGGLARAALGALGGPIGLVTTALSLGATAWLLWGDKAEEGASRAAAGAAEHLDGLIDKLSEMNTRLDQTSRRAFDNLLAGAESDLKTVREEIRKRQNELGGLDASLGKKHFTEGRRLELQGQINALASREIELQAKVAEARSRTAEVGTAGLNKFIEANAVGAEKVSLAQRKLVSEFAAAVEQTGGVFDYGNKAHVAALAALNRALEDSDKAAGKSASALVKQRYTERLEAIKESLAAEEVQIKIARAKGELDERAYLDRMGDVQREAFAAREAALREQLSTASDPADRERLLGEIRAVSAEAARAAGEATLAYVELDRAARATLATLTSEAWSEAGKIATDNAALREELVTLGMTTAQLDEYRRQKTLAARESANDFAAALEAAAAAIDGEGEAAQRAKQYYLDLAAARRAAAEQLGERATLERQLATSREALRLATESAKVWQDGWQETDRIARDAFVAWADDGASAAERIGQSLRSALLSAIYEATLRPLALQVYTTAAGALGLSGGAAGASGGGILGMASNAKSLYDLASGDYGLYGSFATSQYGQALGLSTAGVTASSIGTGASLGYGGLFANGATAGSASGVASMSTLGSALPWAAGGGILAGILYDGKGQSAAGGAIGAGVGYAAAAGSGWAAGASMGSAAGPIGAIAGAIIGGFLGSKIGGGGERFKTTYGSASGLYDDGRYTSTGAWQGGRQYGDDVDQVLDRATQAFSARLGSLYDAFGLDDQIAAQASVRLRRTSGRLASGFEADLDGDGPQGLTTLVSAQYGGDGEVEGALADFVTAILTKGIKTAVEKSDLPEIVKQLYAPLTETADIEAATVTILAAQQILTSAGTTMTEFLGSTAESYLRGEENLIGMLDRTVTALAAVNPVLEDIGLAAIDFTLAGGDLASQLAAISGGLDAFVGKASTYYQQFFSEEERIGRLSMRLAEQFEALGYAMPTDHAGFRALVEGLGEIDESTAGTFAALMNLAPAFDTVADAAEAAANSAMKAAEEQAQGFARAQAAAAAARDERMISENQAYEARYSALQAEYNALRGISRAAADAASYIHSGEKALYRLVTTLEGAISQAEAAVRATDSAYADVQRVVRDAQGANASLQAVASDTIKTVGALADYLSGAIRDLYADAQSTADQSARHGLAYVKQAAEAAVSTGYLPDTDGLREAVDAARAGISDDGLSRYEQDYRRLVLAGYLSQIESVAEPQVSFAEQQLSAAEASNEWLQQILDSVQRQYELFRDGALNGTSVLSLPDTIERLEQAMQSETLAQLRVEGLRRLDPANPDWYAQLSPGMAGRDLSAILALEAILQSGALNHPKADEAIANLNNFYINPLSPVYRVGLPTQDQEAMLKALQQMNDRLAAIEQHSRKTATAVNGNPDQPLPTAIYEDAT